MSDPVRETLSAAAETVLTFLESVGRRSEAEFYLELFRKLPKQSFALVLVRERALAAAPESLMEQLKFLTDLGLRATLVLGAWSSRGVERALSNLAASLARGGLASSSFDLAAPDLPARLTRALEAEEVPLVRARPGDFARIGALAHELKTRKLVVVRREGGLGPHGVSHLELTPGHTLQAHGSGISVINLRADRAALLASGTLSQADAALLESIETVLENSKLRRTTLSVTSPLTLLRELFTVKGAGTLVKLGSAIKKHESYATLDRERLAQLLESSFERRLARHFFDEEPEAIYLEEDYRGAAIVLPGMGGAFLSKFAVDPVARGEGIGQDLWRAMERDATKLYLRARPDNPILSWYKSVCQGFLQHQDWCVLWRGYFPEEVASLVHDALARPIDFEA